MQRDFARWTSFLLLSHAISSLACGGLLPEQGGGAGAEAEGQDYQNGADPGTCDAWKESYCAFKEECEGTWDLCATDVGYVRCHADAPVADCQELIDDAVAEKDCHALPAECTPEGVADRTVPIQQCQDTYEAMCEVDYYCSINNDIEGCVATLNRGAPCSGVYAAWPGGEICAASVRKLSCGDALPEECIEVFRFEE